MIAIPRRAGITHTICVDQLYDWRSYLLIQAALSICCSTKFTMEPRILLGIARIHDMLNDPDKAIGFYKRVLVLDASNVESIACLGAHYFYADQVHSCVEMLFLRFFTLQISLRCV